MGAAPIVIFRGLRQSRAQGLGELGTPHFPGCRPAWWNPKLYHLYKILNFNRGPSACVLRQREKAFYYDAREAHYIRFGPRAWFDPDMRGRNSHHF